MPFLKLLGSIDFGGSVLERSSSFSVEDNEVYNLALGSGVQDIVPQVLLAAPEPPGSSLRSSPPPPNHNARCVVQYGTETSL